MRVDFVCKELLFLFFVQCRILLGCPLLLVVPPSMSLSLVSPSTSGRTSFDVALSGVAPLLVLFGDAVEMLIQTL